MRAGRDVHLDEGTLVRLVDDELSADERRGVEAHLSGCEPCRRERDRIEALSRAFSGWAGWAEPAEPPRLAGVEEILRAADGADADGGRGRRSAGGVVGTILRAPAFRAAAVLVLLAGVALAFPPVSRWVEERVAGPTAGPGEVAPSADVAPGSISVSFRPAGERLTVRVERLPARGSVRIAPGAGPDVEARVIGGEGDEELTVLPDGLAVRIPEGSTADFAIAVPVTVRAIDLFVAGRRVWSGAPDALPMEWTTSAGADAPADEGAER